MQKILLSPRPTDDFNRWRGLLHALASPARGLLSAWFQQHSLSQQDLAWLKRQSLLDYGFCCAQTDQALDVLPAEIATTWQQSYQQSVITVGSIDWQLAGIFTQLRQAGLDFTWVKGGSLAYTIYPNPASRARGDLDLWIPSTQWEAACAALEALHYHPVQRQDRPQALTALIGGELQLVRANPRPQLVELQTPALRGEWARYTAAIDHEGIWQRRTPLSFMGQDVHTLCAEDALIHLCLHHAINHQFSKPWLRNVLDVHLLACQPSLQWSDVVARAKTWRVATSTWSVLHLAQWFFATPVPPHVMQTLAPTRLHKAFIARLGLENILLVANELGYAHRRLWIQMTLTDRWRDNAHLVMRSLWPEDAWLQARYTLTQNQSPWPARAAHIKQLLFSARA